MSCRRHTEPPARAAKQPKPGKTPTPSSRAYQRPYRRVRHFVCCCRLSSPSQQDAPPSQTTNHSSKHANAYPQSQKRRHPSFWLHANAPPPFSICRSSAYPQTGAHLVTLALLALGALALASGQLQDGRPIKCVTGKPVDVRYLLQNPQAVVDAASLDCIRCFCEAGIIQCAATCLVARPSASHPQPHPQPHQHPLPQPHPPPPPGTQRHFPRPRPFIQPAPAATTKLLQQAELGAGPPLQSFKSRVQFQSGQQLSPATGRLAPHRPAAGKQPRLFTIGPPPAEPPDVSAMFGKDFEAYKQRVLDKARGRAAAAGAPTTAATTTTMPTTTTSVPTVEAVTLPVTGATAAEGIANELETDEPDTGGESIEQQPPSAATAATAATAIATDSTTSSSTDAPQDTEPPNSIDDIYSSERVLLKNAAGIDAGQYPAALVSRARLVQLVAGTVVCLIVIVLLIVTKFICCQLHLWQLKMHAKAAGKTNSCNKLVGRPKTDSLQHVSPPSPDAKPAATQQANQQADFYHRTRTCDNVAFVIQPSAPLFDLHPKISVI